jgi:hypothetical protein
MLLAVSAPPSRAIGSNSFVLTGNWVQAGIGSGGGIIDDALTVGLKYDKTGAGSFSAVDYLVGSVGLEFYSLRINGVWKAAGTVYGNNFGAFTDYGDSHLSAQTIFTYGDLWVNQVVYFGLNNDTLSFNIFGVNYGSVTLTDVVYARGLDPNPDMIPFGVADTINTITGNKVRALGGWSGLYIELVDHTGFGVPTVDYNWTAYPNDLLVPHNDGDGDNTINLAWNIGNVGPGEYFFLYFDYVLGDPPPLYGPQPAHTPLPAPVWLVGAGLLGLALHRGLRRRP